MKIVRIIARLNVGGPARHVVFLTHALQDEEFSSYLIAGSVPSGEEDMSFFAEEYGVTVDYVREMSRELSLKDLISIIKILRRIRREKPDIIHTHTAKAGTLGRSAAVLYRWLTWKTLIGMPRPVKVVHTFHGHVFHSYYGKLKTRIFIMIERFLAAVATDSIIVISPKQLEEISREFGIGRRKQFEIVPLGIDVDTLKGQENERESFRNDIGIGDEELLVTFVGRLTEIKNIPLLLEVIHLYQSTRTDDSPKLKFAIIGDGHLRKLLEDRASALGIVPLLSFLGNRKDVSRFYAGSDIVALNSLNEGTPLSLIEAMAASRPVISTGVGGVIDLLGESLEEQDGFRICERGIRVDIADANNYLSGLIYLARSEKLRLEFSARGRAYAESNYSKDRLVRDIKTLYRRLAAE
jgi:glycosyltransferase involved in cell wall biosynthesis